MKGRERRRKWCERREDRMSGFFFGDREGDGAGDDKQEEMGEGGFAGMKRLGTAANVAITAMESVRRETSSGVVHMKGLTNWANAPPKGFASEAIAVAVMRPWGLYHSSEKRVGAARTNGWASPTRICPNITIPRLPPCPACIPSLLPSLIPPVVLLVPAYRTQFPATINPLATRSDNLGPPRWSAHKVNGLATTKAKRKDVDSQAMVRGVVRKKVEAVSVMGAYVSHE